MPGDTAEYCIEVWQCLLLSAKNKTFPGAWSPWFDMLFHQSKTITTLTPVTEVAPTAVYNNCSARGT